MAGIEAEIGAGIGADLPAYRIYAIRYAHHERPASENFIGGDPHDFSTPLDYFVWAIVGPDRVFALDSGFTPEMADKRGRTFLNHPADVLPRLGVAPEDVEDVIISHMHYDHAGNLGLFPNARLHVQDREMQFCTGRYMCHDSQKYGFEAEDVAEMVRRLFAGKVEFHDGDDEIAPGITVHRIGGHTMGLQATKVWTARGWVVLASDATHLYANMEQARPFPVVFNVGDMLEGFKTLRKLAPSPAHIVPGHDPAVLRRYPAPAPDLEGIVACLDVAPVEA
jgi:glyoxylase-like metal-dependent hydrolase (beta-lactamase superfamily II)